jgi:hypothetical protein
MAFFGDLGRFFNIETSEAAQIGAQLATGNIGGAVASGVRAVATPIPEGESRPSDVSGPPAGVDSPATLSAISQTSGMDGTFRIPSSAQGFGMNQAFLGGFGLPGLVSTGVGAATRALSRPGVGGLIGGLGAGAVVDFFIDEFGREKKLVITRKLQRDIKKIFMMTGGDVRTTSDIYRSATGRFIPEDKILKILFKTFKNQGPYVTKAAVRKTRSTIRKMETLCDLKDRLCPPKRAPARRRAPAKSTTITNVR